MNGGNSAAAGAAAVGLSGVSAETIGIVRIIKHLQRLGFSLKEIKEPPRGGSCGRSRGDGQRKLASKIGELDAKIAELQSIRATLWPRWLRTINNEPMRRLPAVRQASSSSSRPRPWLAKGREAAITSVRSREQKSPAGRPKPLEGST
jgi:DNA-binding transcriptional MerR regulator